MGRPADPSEDEVLFEEAMEGVRRIDPVHRIPEPVFRPPVTISEREHEVLQELDALVAGAGELELHDPDDQIAARVPGLDPRVLRRLAAGEFTVQADLDLHGSDAATARGLVETFIVAAHARGLRCLRIIHGRGRGSPGGVPVLKGQLPRWLARGPARLLVLAYTTATPRDGGAGATYVLLRRSRR
jgi:DNA-nicking Smr family endonuclease